MAFLCTIWRFSKYVGKKRQLLAYSGISTLEPGVRDDFQVLFLPRNYIFGCKSKSTGAEERRGDATIQDRSGNNVDSQVSSTPVFVKLKVNRAGPFSQES
jgi:hypothetical protein